MLYELIASGSSIGPSKLEFFDQTVPGVRPLKYLPREELQQWWPCQGMLVHSMPISVYVVWWRRQRLRSKDLLVRAWVLGALILMPGALFQGTLWIKVSYLCPIGGWYLSKHFLYLYPWDPDFVSIITERTHLSIICKAIRGAARTCSPLSILARMHWIIKGIREASPTEVGLAWML